MKVLLEKCGTDHLWSCIPSSIRAGGPAFKPICLWLEALGLRLLTRTRTGEAAWEEALELAPEVALEEALRGA